MHLNVIEIPVADIKLLDEHYPRAGFDADTVSQYRLGLDKLPPIDVTHEHILIDGYHRLIAYRMQQKETIPCQVRRLEVDEILWEATKLNAAHGLQLSMSEKRKLARTFFKQEKKQADIAEVLSVSAGSVSTWVKDLKQEQDAERDAKIFDMWLACYTHEEIAEAVGLARNTVTEIVGKFKSEETDIVPDSLQLFNLWAFKECDDRYGMDYPGRIPGQIVENVLYYFTEPFNTVIDPMAGGGTTLDVCKAMYRRYRCYDINPVRDDIKRHDIINGFPPESRGCDLIFLDPPYWSQKKGDYSAEESNLANLPLDDYYAEMARIFQGALEILARGGHLAVIVGPTQASGLIYDHAHEFYKMLEKLFGIVARVIVPYTTQQAQPYHVSDAKEGRYMLKLYRDLIIARK